MSTIEATKPVTGSPPSSGSLHGLKSRALGFPTLLAQSVALISPTMTAVLIIPICFADSGQGTWLAYLFATVGLVLVGTNINQFTRRSTSPGALYAFVTRGLGVPLGFLCGWCLILAYMLTGMAVMAGSVNYAGLLLDAEASLFTGGLVPPLLLLEQ